MVVREEQVPKQKNSFQSWFTKNYQLKLIAAATALALMMYQRLREAEEVRTINVPLSVIIPKDSSKPGVDLRLVEVAPSDIQLTIRGKRSTLERAMETIEPLRIELSGKLPNPYTLDSEQFSLPSSLKIEDIEPNSLDLSVEQWKSRDIGLSLATTGKLAPHLEIISWELEPPQLRVEGPNSRLVELKSLPIRGIELDNLVEGRNELSTTIQPLPKNFKANSHQPIRVIAEVRPKSEVLKFRLPVELVGMVGAKLSPAELLVRLKASAEQLRDIDDKLLSARVQMPAKHDAHGSLELPVQIFPEELKATAEPSTILVSW